MCTKKEKVLWEIKFDNKTNIRNALEQVMDQTWDKYILLVVFYSHNISLFTVQHFDQSALQMSVAKADLIWLMEIVAAHQIKKHCCVKVLLSVCNEVTGQ